MYKAGDVLRQRYTIISLLGIGGSGCVYLAKDSNIGKLWAIKEINISYMGDKPAQSEILMLKSIDHHCFPRITDAFSDQNHFYIVSDYIEGISLAQLLESGPLTKLKAYKFAYQIAQAIEYLHSYDPPILYLDLKPENIMVKPDERLCLIDFGISSFITSDCGGYGTKGYAAPEQYKRAGRNVIDERADVYAFGETYLAMRTAHRPEADAHSHAKFLKDCTLLNSLEKKFISKCTHVDPAGRFTSMHQARTYLDHINFFSSNPIRMPVFIILVLLAFLLIFSIIGSNKKDYTKEMLDKAAVYMEDGEYTMKSLAVMENYINSGLLSDSNDSYYSFLVGRTYFEKYMDFREALRYFERLDEKDYPQKKYYIELCKLSTGFEYDVIRLKECLEEFTDDAIKMRKSLDKYDNLLFAAFCFEYYLKDDAGREYALKIYDYIEKDLEEAKDNMKDGTWETDIILKARQGRELLNEYS